MFRSLFFSLAATLFLLFPAASQAQLVQCGTSTTSACTFCDFFVLIQNIINIFLFPFVPIIGALLIVVGGFLMIVGSASPTMRRRGQTILMSVAIGAVIIYSAWVVINTVLMLLGVSVWTGLGNWWQITC